MKWVADLADSSQIRLDDSWKNRLLGEFDKDYMRNLRQFLASEKQAGKLIYPKGTDFFHALDATPFDQVKVVIPAARKASTRPSRPKGGAGDLFLWPPK